MNEICAMKMGICTVKISICTTKLGICTVKIGICTMKLGICTVKIGIFTTKLDICVYKSIKTPLLFYLLKKAKSFASLNHNIYIAVGRTPVNVDHAHVCESTMFTQRIVTTNLSPV